ncbi:hypothetical protein [Amycolatopsis xylanica]|uniref:hypothetical protein n=1 Tax=Amycolatopsis xylanica TaxID=589385 RepID=UPI000B861E2F|nr:hypothetical protein [Amycolatopsis xylanica]
MTTSASQRLRGIAAVTVSVLALLVSGVVSADAAVTAATGTVKTAGDPLNVRRAPSTNASAVRTVANGATVSIDCQTIGSSVEGPLGKTTLWDYVPALGGYISDGYVYTGSDERIAPDCGVGSGSAECSSGTCAAEGVFKSAGAKFVVYDNDGDGKSGVVAYWLKGGAGPFYAWNSGGTGTSKETAINVPKGGWVYYKVCVANYSATNPVLEACSGGITDYVA